MTREKTPLNPAHHTIRQQQRLFRNKVNRNIFNRHLTQDETKLLQQPSITTNVFLIWKLLLWIKKKDPPTTCAFWITFFKKTILQQSLPNILFEFSGGVRYQSANLKIWTILLECDCTSCSHFEYGGSLNSESDIPIPPTLWLHHEEFPCFTFIKDTWWEPDALYFI